MAKPAWLIPKKKPNTSKISTRNVVKKHLKEWNFDDVDEDLYEDISPDDQSTPDVNEKIYEIDPRTGKKKRRIF